ncbi:MAG: hypothetical protein WKG06_00110 [Segetibacter sp.]
MSFNELNSVEHFVIHQLTGVNLNNVKSGNLVQEPSQEYETVKWKYVQSDLLSREIDCVVIEKELKAALLQT